MKKTLLWALLALLLVAVIAGAGILYDRYKEEYKEETEPAVDRIAAPNFTVFDTDGNAVKLSDFKGKPVVLNFWTSWCYYCKQEMPHFDNMSKKYPNVQFLMVNATDGIEETESAARKYIADAGYEFDIFFDLRGEATYVYGVTGFPTTYFIDSNGEIVARTGGALDGASLENGIKMIGG